MTLNSFYIAGVQHHQLYSCINELSEGCLLSLVPEPTNKFDPNAVRIEYTNNDGESIMCGYVPKKFSSNIAAMLELRKELICEITALNVSAKPWEQCYVEIRNDEDDEDDEDNFF